MRSPQRKRPQARCPRSGGAFARVSPRSGTTPSGVDLDVRPTAAGVLRPAQRPPGGGCRRDPITAAPCLTPVRPKHGGGVGVAAGCGNALSLRLCFVSPAGGGRATPFACLLPRLLSLAVKRLVSRRVSFVGPRLLPSRVLSNSELGRFLSGQGTIAAPLAPFGRYCQAVMATQIGAAVATTIMKCPLSLNLGSAHLSDQISWGQNLVNLQKSTSGSTKGSCTVAQLALR